MRTNNLIGIAALVLALAACSGDDSASDLSHPTPTSALPVQAPTTTIEPDSLALIDSTTPTTETTIASTTTTVADPIPDPSCASPRYEVTIPDGWHNENCTIFSPFEIPATGEREYRPEIDIHFTTSESYGEAFDRVSNEFEVDSFTTFYVDGNIASVFTLSEEWYATGKRTVYVIDAGDGVLFASANELIDTEPVADLHAHYEESLEQLHEMMATASIVFTG